MEENLGGGKGVGSHRVRESSSGGEGVLGDRIDGRGVVRTFPKESSALRSLREGWPTSGEESWNRGAVGRGEGKAWLGGRVSLTDFGKKQGGGGRDE